MITIFNRKELLITYGIQKQSKVRTVLQNNGIKYIVKVLNLRSPSPLSIFCDFYNLNLTLLSKGVRLKMSNDIRLKGYLCRMVIRWNNTN